MINKYTLVYLESGGRKDRSNPAWYIQVAVIDQLPWRKLPRVSEATFLEGGRSGRWAPDPSRLGDDQLSYLKSRSRLAETFFLEGGRSGKWIPDPSRLGDNQLQELKSRSRLAEVAFLEGGRAPSPPRWIPDPSILATDQLPYLKGRSRLAEVTFLEGGRERSLGSIYTVAPPPDPLAWTPRNRTYVHILEPDRVRLCAWIPDPSILATDQIPYLRSRSRLAEVLFDPGSRSGKWTPDSSRLGDDQIGWVRPPGRNLEVRFLEAGRALPSSAIFSLPPPVDDLSWIRKNRLYVHVFDPDRVRLCFWVADASQLSGDQIGYLRSRSRVVETLFDIGNRSGNWRPDASQLGNDQVAWVRVPGRNVEVRFLEGGRVLPNDGWYTQTINPPPGNTAHLLPLTGAGPA